MRQGPLLAQPCPLALFPHKPYFRMRCRGVRWGILTSRLCNTFQFKGNWLLVRLSRPWSSSDATMRSECPGCKMCGGGKLFASRAHAEARPPQDGGARGAGAHGPARLLPRGGHRGGRHGDACAAAAVGGDQARPPARPLRRVRDVARRRLRRAQLHHEGARRPRGRARLCW